VWYWLSGLTSGEPLGVVAIYRHGDDIGYYPLIRSLSQLHLGDDGLLEMDGQYPISFSHLPLLLHAIALRTLGIGGLGVADIIVIALYYGCVCLLLRELDVKSPIREALAFVVVCCASSFINKCLIALGASDVVQLWDYRIPRPFVTNVFMVICMVVLLRVFGRDRWRHIQSWIALGLALAAVQQSDTWTGFALGLCAATGFVSLLVRHAAARQWRILGYAGIACVVFVAAMTPFILQRVFEHPDVPRRLGVFAVSRWPPLFRLPSLKLLIALPVAAGLLTVLSRKHRGSRPPIGFLWAPVAGFTCAVLAAPVSTFALGKTVQPYHFGEVIETFFSYAMLVYAAHLLQLLGAWIADSDAHWLRDARVVLSHGKVKAAVVVAFACALVPVPLDLWRQATRETRHIRKDFAEYASLPSYRRDFTALVRELKRIQYAPCEVLGTFDWQLWSWWTALEGRHVFITDPFASGAPDTEIERRLAQLCAQINMTPEDFRSFILRRYVNHFWLGHQKYQASAMHTFAPLTHYSPELRRQIQSTSSNWNLAVPDDEQDRLVQLYIATKGAGDRRPADRLDLIVLTNDDSLRSALPKSDRYDLVYQNDIFRVFKVRNEGIHRVVEGR
jgi:hypothetical protein